MIEKNEIKATMTGFIDASKKFKEVTDNLLKEIHSHPEIYRDLKVAIMEIWKDPIYSDVKTASKIMAVIENNWNPLASFEITENETEKILDNESKEWEPVQQTFLRWRRYHAVFQLVIKSKKTGKFYATENYIGGESTEPGYGTRYVEVFPEPDVKTKYLTLERDYFREK